MNTTLDTAIESLVEAIKADYLSFTRKMWKSADGELSDFNKDQVAKFNSGISVTHGKKYAKIVTECGAVWGFVVAVDDDKKFARGAILKPAGWAAPARNFGRGNVITGGYTVRWTGA